MGIFSKIFKRSKNVSGSVSEAIKTDKDYWDMFSRIRRDFGRRPGWIDVEKHSCAPKDGLYVFRCAGDNHDIWEPYELKEGESLHKYFMEPHIHGDGWWPIVAPMDYLSIPPYSDNNPDWMKVQRQPIIGESIEEFNDGGFIIVAIKISGRIIYYDQENCPYIRREPAILHDVKTKEGLTVLFFKLYWDVDIPEDCYDEFSLLGFYEIK